MYQTSANVIGCCSWMA